MARSIPVSVVNRLAEVFLETEGDHFAFADAVEEAFPDECVLVLYSYHPNLETLLPVLVFREGDVVELVWGVADELAEDLAPQLWSR